jgi:hypothetical protein
MSLLNTPYSKDNKLVEKRLKIYRVFLIIPKATHKYGHVYIGSTSSALDRFLNESVVRHDNKSLKNPALVRLFDIYGRGNFIIKLIDETDSVEESIRLVQEHRRAVKSVSDVI